MHHLSSGQFPYQPFPSDPLTQGGPILSNSFSLLLLYIFPFSLENLALTRVQVECATVSALTHGRDAKNSEKFRTFSLSLLFITFIIFITCSMREGGDLAEMQITATLIMSLHKRLKHLKPGWSSLKCCRDRGVLDTYHAHLVFIYVTSEVYMGLGLQARQQLHFGRSWQSRHSTSPPTECEESGRIGIHCLLQPYVDVWQNSQPRHGSY